MTQSPSVSGTKCRATAGAGDTVAPHHGPMLIGVRFRGESSFPLIESVSSPRTV
jgi:hypothetical protein